MAATTYTVKSGDTLYAIARKYGTTVSELVRLNNIPNANIIYVGQVLVISGEAVQEEASKNFTITPTVGLQADTDRTLVARWDWTKTPTKHYEVRWWWGPEGQLGILGEETTTEQKYAVYNAPTNAERVSFYVKPVATNGQWTADWSTKVTYYFKDNPPLTPSAPSVEIKDYQLTATLDNLQDLNAESIEFHVYQDNGHLFASETVDIVTYHASCTFTIDPGHDYKVQCRSWRDGICSDWSGYSDNKTTKPSAPGGITTCRANSSTSVYLAWSAVDNADSYDIEYATKKEYFDSSNKTTTQSGIKTATYILTGLESGQNYFFRVRAVNGQGESAWSSIVSIVLGKKPSPPTTWSSTTTAIVGEALRLYWTHNSEDGSKQVTAQLELDIGGKKSTISIDNPDADDEEAEEKISYYDFSTSGYTEGTTLLWRVKTCGITGEYSDWSTQRTVNIYAPPTLVLTVTNHAGSLLSQLTSFPFSVRAVAGPNTQTAIGYHLSVVANESYETVDRIGNKIIVSKGSEVYSRHFDSSGNLNVTLSANDLDLANNVTYTITCTVTMNSGLSATASSRFTVAWRDEMYGPNAEIGIHKDTYSAAIRPYCEDENGALIQGVTLAVYRRMFDGSFVEIATGLANTAYTFVVDPHPALDYARYRIVATTISTGAVSYADIAGFSVGGTAAIIQWDEEWSDFDVGDSEVKSETTWKGSMLQLPYNIDVSEGPQNDVELIEYIGRKYPVSYYGTQLGYSATWKTDVPASDKETLYALRRLMTWMGDVYVREPSGTGYWATVSVSMNVDHCAVIVPVTLNITRVEGGV